MEACSLLPSGCITVRLPLNQISCAAPCWKHPVLTGVASNSGVGLHLVGGIHSCSPTQKPSHHLQATVTCCEVQSGGATLQQQQCQQQPQRMGGQRVFLQDGATQGQWHVLGGCQQLLPPSRWYQTNFGSKGLETNITDITDTASSQHCTDLSHLSCVFIAS
jgi:hypothetical protein